MHVVTGGAGFIGSNLVRALRARGAEVWVVDAPDAPGRPSNLAGAGVAEYLDKDLFLSLVERRDTSLARVEAVLHQGACADTTESDAGYLHRNNCEYGAAVARWCVERRIPFLYASSAAVYGPGPRFTEEPGCEQPLNAYARSKLELDRAVRALLPIARSPLVGLRYFNVYGPGEAHKGPMASTAWQLHQQIAASGVARLFEGHGGYADGEQRRDFVHVDDVVSVNLWFLGSSGVSGIFNVGTGRARSFNDLARAVIRGAGRGRIAYRPFPPRLRSAYQSFTEADPTALRAAGYVKAFRHLEQGVVAYAAWLDGGAKCHPEQRQ